MAFVIGIVAFYELGRRLVPEHVAETSALFAAFFPMSFVFSMTYPESLVPPAYWGLAVLAPQGGARRAVLMVSAALLVAGTMTVPLATP